MDARNGKSVGHMPTLKDLRWEAKSHCLCGMNIHCLSGIKVNFLAGEKKWLVVVGAEARWEVSGKIRRVMEDVGVGVRVQCKSVNCQGLSSDESNIGLYC